MFPWQTNIILYIKFYPFVILCRLKKSYFKVDKYLPNNIIAYYFIKIKPNFMKNKDRIEQIFIDIFPAVEYND